MATLWQRLWQERTDLKTEGDGLIEAAGAENRDLNEEEIKRSEEILARLGAIDTQLNVLNKQREAQREQPVSGHALVTDGSHVEVVDNTNNFHSFGEFLKAVADAGKPGGQVDARLYEPQAASGLSSGVPSEGGFLVRTDFSTMLLDKAREEAILLPMCTPVPIGEGADGIELPVISETSRATGSRWGGVQVYRITEAETVTATKPKFAKLEIRLEDMMGLCYATERSLRDATSLGAIIQMAFASEAAFKIDDEIIRGDGASQCLGILNSDALVSVAAESGQSADTILPENLSKMWACCPAKNRTRAAWIANQEIEPELDRLAYAVGTGALPVPWIRYGPEGVLLIKGRPVVVIEQAAKLGDVGDIILADMSQYLIAQKDGLVAADSIHVKFIYNERAFRFVWSIKGAPAWLTSITPYKRASGTYISPFVALAAR